MLSTDTYVRGRVIYQIPSNTGRDYGTMALGFVVQRCILLTLVLKLAPQVTHTHTLQITE